MARLLTGVKEEQLPQTVTPGAFHVLVASRGDFPVLRPAFVLPLRWERDAEHSVKLPKSLLKHADDAVALYRRLTPSRPDGGGKSIRWGLTPNFPESADVNISGLDIDGLSAMAAMLASLRLADANLRSVGTVLASVAWNGKAWSRVEGVAAKLDAALASGATRVFLSDDNKNEVDAWERASGTTGIVQFIQAESNPWRSLEPFLHELEAPPLPDASLEIHARYYARALAPRPRGDAGRDYYLETLVRPLAVKCESDPGVRGIRGPVCCLVGCIAPGIPPVVALLARLLRPQMVKLIHSPLRDEQDELLKRDLKVVTEHLRGEAGVDDVELWELDLVKLPLEELAAKLGERLTTVGADASERLAGSRLVIDVTNGPKRLSLALLKALPAEATCVLVDSQQIGPRLHRIGSEKVVVIRPDSQ